MLAQARDPEAAAATRPFAVNGDRLAVQFPDETHRYARRHTIRAVIRTVIASRTGMTPSVIHAGVDDSRVSALGGQSAVQVT